MCGACGRGRADWLSSFLSGSYQRTVVAARLSSTRPKLTITAGAAGWVQAPPGRPLRYHRTLRDLLVSVCPRLDNLSSWPRHRALLIDPATVPAGLRGAATPPPWADSDPGTVINRLLAAAIRDACDAANSQRVAVRGPHGSWWFNTELSGSWQVRLDDRDQHRLGCQ